MHGGHPAKHRVLTRVDAMFKEAYARAAVGGMSKTHKKQRPQKYPTPEPRDVQLKSPRTAKVQFTAASAEAHAPSRDLGQLC